MKRVKRHLVVALVAGGSCHCSASHEPLPPVRPAAILEVGSPTICLLPPEFPPAERVRVGALPNLQGCLGTAGNVTLVLRASVSREGEVVSFSASAACWDSPYSFTPTERRCLAERLARVRYVPDGDSCPLRLHFTEETFVLKGRALPTDAPGVASAQGRRTRACS